MKRTAVNVATMKIYKVLLERFGEPIGAAHAGQGVNDEPRGRPRRGAKMGNRGFGSQVSESDDMCCQHCGMMTPMDQDHACGMEESDDELDEVTPPGGEKVVKALKKQKGVKNPWAIAWSMKKKGEF